MVKRECINDIPLSFIKGENINLVLVNQPILISFDLFVNIWNRALIKLCADGAANRLFDFCKENGQDGSLYLPDAIIGDLDSAQEDVCKYYREKGVQLFKIEEQDSTDLDKCLRHLISKAHEEYTIVLGGLSGRFDHVFSCLYSLFQYPSEKIHLLDHENIVTLLTAGEHHIVVDQRTQGPACGLVPLDEQPLVSTCNLVWELSGVPCAFKKGGLISTCNKIKCDPNSIHAYVTVKTSGNILWMIEHRMS